MTRHTGYGGMQLTAWLLVLFWVAVLGCCAGCGGGGPDEPDQSIGPPDCRNHPEHCV